VVVSSVVSSVVVSSVVVSSVVVSSVVVHIHKFQLSKPSEGDLSAAVARL
jgi:hypothetical protein